MMQTPVYCLSLSLIEHLVLREYRHEKLRDWSHQERKEEEQA
jgi:hypothetical protein